MRLHDVDLSERDDDRVERLADSLSFTEAEAEAIVRFGKVDPDDRDPSQITNYVRNGDAPDTQDGITEVECDRIRRAMSKADRPSTVIDRYSDTHPSVIFRHATGGCDHDGDADPTTSPRIKPDECREMRADLQTGDSVEDLQAAYNRSTNAVVRHVFGRCDHAFDHDRAGRELSAAVCNRMRIVYREHDSVSIADVGRAFVVGASTAHRHLTGACRHRDDVEPPATTDRPPRVDKRECGLMRAVYAVGASPPDVASAFDRDPTAVRRHVFGRCDHGGSGATPPEDRIGRKRCMAIRHEYRTRGVDSVASVVDRLNISSRGVFYYHLKGDCSHEHGVPAVEPGDEV